jgi:hypothetical protein
MANEIEVLRKHTERILTALSGEGDGSPVGPLIAERSRHLKALVDSMKRGALPAREEMQELQRLETETIRILRSHRDALYAELVANRRARAAGRAYGEMLLRPPVLQLDSER